jgi:hypothetical protein
MHDRGFLFFSFADGKEIRKPPATHAGVARGRESEKSSFLLLKYRHLTSDCK